MPSTRITAYAPDGKQKYMLVNDNHFSTEEIKEITTQFKRFVHQGREPRDFKKTLLMSILHAPKKTTVIPVTVTEKKPFDFKHIDSLKLPENGAMSFCMIGSTRSGKSYAINHIWENIFKKHITLLMTQSSHAEIYKQFKKHAVIVDGFYKELIEEPMKINKETGIHYNFCLVFDDLVMKGKNEESMTKLLTIGRNCGMSAIISGQKLTMLSPTGRSNINFVCCFKQNTENAIEDTIKTYLRSYFPKHLKITEMISLYKELTEDHHFFVIDTLNDQCFLSKI